jgi:uncharacterized protein
MAEARTLVAGHGEGPILELGEPLSFWGGIDPSSGLIVDRHHPWFEASIVGTVLVMPSGRGSSSSSAVLAEAIRAGVAPAAIVLREIDPIVALGALVARELYGILVPVVVSDVIVAREHRASVDATPDRATVTVR